MIMVSTTVPILTLCLVLLYVVLFRRFLKIKSKLPFSGLKGEFGRKKEKDCGAGNTVFSCVFCGTVSYRGMGA